MRHSSSVPHPQTPPFLLYSLQASHAWLGHLVSRYCLITCYWVLIWLAVGSLRSRGVTGLIGLRSAPLSANEIQWRPDSIHPHLMAFVKGQRRLTWHLIGCLHIPLPLWSVNTNITESRGWKVTDWFGQLCDLMEEWITVLAVIFLHPFHSFFFLSSCFHQEICRHSADTRWLSYKRWLCLMSHVIQDWGATPTICVWSSICDL